MHFVHGRIAETRDSTRVATDTAIGSQLLKRALVNETQLREALASRRRNPRPLGTLLVERGYVARGRPAAMSSRGRSPTRSSPPSSRPPAPSCSSATPTPRPVDFITIDTQSVLLEISALGGAYCLAVEMLGQANTVLVRNGDYETLPRNPLLHGPGRVHGPRAGRRPAARCARSRVASGLEEITVISILGKLADAGVVLVKAERQSRADDDVELQAHRDSVWAEVSQLLDDISDGAPAARPRRARSRQGPDAAA